MVGSNLSSGWRMDVQDAVLIEDLHLLCGQTHPGDVRPVVAHKTSRYCDLSHACTDVFGSTMMGIAGSFTQ